jgi:N-acyl-phosphatidylethanolamine-hydrolysing phospholipase D
MSKVHCNPEDAVQVHIEIKSQRSVGMHYLTFILTDEPILEPIDRLRRALELKNLPRYSFDCIKIGETISYCS